jgi:hypothetical protein
MNKKADGQRNKRTASQEEHEKNADAMKWLNNHGGKPIAAVEPNAAAMVGGLCDGEDSRWLLLNVDVYCV